MSSENKIPQENIFVCQLKCARCGASCALLSSGDISGAMKQTEQIGCMFLCDRCFATFKDNINFAMSKHLMNANFKNMNRDGTWTNNEGFPDP